MKTKRAAYSKEFATFYDTYMSSNFPSISNRITTLLDKYNPTGSLLLDVGCGTGKVLEYLPKRYSFAGIDISPHMLEIAKKKFPKSQFVQTDMTLFRLGKKFDAIICLSDTFNHLLTYSDWEKTFSTINSHLKKGGIFIFDINTPIRMKRLSKMQQYVSPRLGNKFFTVKVSHVKGARYNFLLHIYTIKKENVLWNEDNVLESAFPLPKVTASLKKYFTVEEMIDIVRPKVSSKTGKAVIVCKK